ADMRRLSSILAGADQRVREGDRAAREGEQAGDGEDGAEAAHVCWITRGTPACCGRPMEATIRAQPAEPAAYGFSISRMEEVRVVLTKAAEEVLRRVRTELGDDLSLVIGNGCCDSTAPFLFARYAPGPAEARI